MRFGDILRGKGPGTRIAGAAIGIAGLAFIGLGTAGVGTITSSVAAVAASSGDNNSGDVWLDNVGQPAGPGHEHDPHLQCENINLWGNGLADSSGTYTIDGWPPSGTGKQAYADTWTYNTPTEGDQVISVIQVAVLIANAQANGDAPINKQGYHFKLQLVQDPQKHKTFWVNCPPTTTSSTTTSSSSPTTTSSTTSSTSSSSPTTTSSTSPTTTTSSSSPTTTTTTSGGGGGLGESTTTTTTTGAGGGINLSLSSSSSGTGASGVLGISTTTPGTGADTEFGAGLAMLMIGGGLLVGSTRLSRRKRP
jgi:hypothetical protein